MHSCFEPLHEVFRKLEEEGAFSPLPAARFIRKAEEQGSCPGLHIEGETVALAFLAAVIPCVGEHAHLEQRNGLQVFVGVREDAMFEKIITGLLDHILQGNEGGIVLLKRLLQRLDGFFDALAVFARRSLLGFGANEAIGEDRLDQLKDLLTLSLPAHQATGRLTFASPLSITGTRWGPDELSHLFPGRSWLRGHEDIDGWPLLHQRCIHYHTTSILHPKRHSP